MSWGSGGAADTVRRGSARTGMVTAGVALAALCGTFALIGVMPDETVSASGSSSGGTTSSSAGNSSSSSSSSTLQAPTDSPTSAAQGSDNSTSGSS
ncbi:hypothetical protein [Actinacidiphila soli]|uniref:hypothetical protein n=1 Tax=Actinacidiphila soli TaxID=2487275 RepID=UPI000FCA9FB2|nr:hypothetical protein [Actinacidiphila soli]